MKISTLQRKAVVAYGVQMGQLKRIFGFLYLSLLLNAWFHGYSVGMIQAFDKIELLVTCNLL
jgi:hypothetical protein